MANVIKIKRSTTTATPSALSEGELAYSESSNNLFIGTSGSNVANIGGKIGVTVQAYDANIVSDATYQSTANDFTTTLKNKLDGVASSANNYVHPTTAGNKHIPTDGAAGQFLKYSASGTAVWAADNNTTYSVGDGGLSEINFTSADNTKLDGIAASANNYSLPTASSAVLGGVKTGTGITNTSGTISVSTAYLADSHAASGVTSTKITAWDNAAAWHSTMTTADADNIINTVNEVVSAFQNHSEGLNLITELDAKLTGSSTIDGGTF